MTEKEKKKVYISAKYEPKKWRKGKNIPKLPGIIVGETISSQTKEFTTLLILQQYLAYKVRLHS
jgi:hypothetical protein